MGGHPNFSGIYPAIIRGFTPLNIMGVHQVWPVRETVNTHMRVTPPGGKYVVHIYMYCRGSDFYASLDRDFTSYIDSTTYTGGAYLSKYFQNGAYFGKCW